MDTQEFINIVEIEGLEYYLRYKNTDWHYLNNPELLKQCHKLVKASCKIETILLEYKCRMPHEK